MEMRRLSFSNDQLAMYFHCSVSTIRRRLRAARRQR
jgi:DNA-directed RNA polymerase specialized sigma24 family protein